MNQSDFVPTVPSDEQRRKIEYVNERFQILVIDLLFTVPNSAHRTCALRHLLDAKMSLIHGITHPFSEQNADKKVPAFKCEEGSIID